MPHCEGGNTHTNEINIPLKKEIKLFFLKLWHKPTDLSLPGFLSASAERMELSGSGSKSLLEFIS